tara:strand:+ start:18117 stop:18575 length:459 start_codon:yes stop_codon:yes gene_type:complete
MNINTTTEVGEIEFDFDLDEDDLAQIIRPIVDLQVDNEISNYDLASMITDEVRQNGTGSIDIDEEAQQLLRQYINGHGPTGDHDGTGCTTAKLFETAVYNANSRLANSEQGSAIVAGVVSTDLANEVRRLAEQIAAIQRALTALGAAIMPLG